MTQQLTIRDSQRQLVEIVRGPDYQQKFKSMLPADVNPERFTAVLVRALQEDPNLAKPSTDRASLLLACQRAAQDGLIPDKREGALVMYGNQVQWQPMILGLRKILALSGFDIRAEVVFANDEFDYSLGDEAFITHKPARLGMERGAAIGAYAIATDRDGRKYRDVMSLAEINKVRAVSRSQNGPWKQWFDEMAKKTVAKRLIKTLPITNERLQDAIAADNAADINLDAGQPKRSSVAEQVQSAARGSVIDGEFAQVPADDGQDDAGDGAPPDHDDPGF
jgi:recombination protein RecT